MTACDTNASMSFYRKYLLTISPVAVRGMSWVCKKQTDAVFNNDADSKSASQRTSCLPTVAQFAQLFKHGLRIGLLGQVGKAFS